MICVIESEFDAFNSAKHLLERNSKMLILTIFPLCECRTKILQMRIANAYVHYWMKTNNISANFFTNISII